MTTKDVVIFVTLDELDTQTLLFPEKSLYLQCFLMRIFDISKKKKYIRCHNYLDIGLLNYKNKQ
jgi:hypothetical protein